MSQQPEDDPIGTRLAHARRAFSADKPDHDAMERMLAKLAAQSGPAAAGAPSRVWRPLGFVAGGLAVGGLLFSLLSARFAAEPAPERRASRPAAQAAPTAAPAPVPPVAPVPPAPTAAKRRTVHTAPSADPLAELALLTRARRVLHSDAFRTLAITDEHLRGYPRGALREERELLAIEALSALGQRAQLVRRARAFERVFPASVHRTRVREILQTADESVRKNPPGSAQTGNAE